MQIQGSLWPWMMLIHQSLDYKRRTLNFGKRMSAKKFNLIEMCYLIGAFKFQRKVSSADVE